MPPQNSIPPLQKRPLTTFMARSTNIYIEYQPPEIPRPPSSVAISSPNHFCHVTLLLLNILGVKVTLFLGYVANLPRPHECMAEDLPTSPSRQFHPELPYVQVASTSCSSHSHPCTPQPAVSFSVSNIRRVVSFTSIRSQCKCLSHPEASIDDLLECAECTSTGSHLAKLGAR